LQTNKSEEAISKGKHFFWVVFCDFLKVFPIILFILIAPTFVLAGTIMWSGRQWTLRSGAHNGGGQYDPAMVVPYSDGTLHLHVKNVSQVWHCAGLYTNDSLGYGVYEWDIDSSVNSVNSAYGFGFYTYGGPSPEYEIDYAEFGHWGNIVNGTKIKFTMQPISGGTNQIPQSYYFNYTGKTTLRGVWSPGSVYYELRQRDNNAVLANWTCTKSTVPTPTPPSPIYIGYSVWDVNNVPSQDSEMIISAFRYSTTVNRPPVLNAIGNKTIAANSTLTFNISATDPDGGTLTYSSTTLPTGATLNSSNGAFAWSPTSAQSGSYPVTFSVSDGKGGNASETITITVTNTISNRAPVLAAIGNKSVNEGTQLQWTVTASDPDGDTVTITTSPLQSWMSFNGTTFTADPGYTNSGNYNVTFTASDGSLTASETITISVGNVNRPPELGVIENKTVVQNSLLTFTVTATDPDNDNLTYSANNLPAGASFNSTTRVFSWTPTLAQVGSYQAVHFEVRDASLSDSEDITINVTNSNTAPVLAAIGDKTVNENSLLTFTLSATDPDGDTLTYSSTTLPSGATLNSSSGAFAWTPPASTYGTYSVTFNVSDGKGGTASQSIRITVIDNDADVDYGAETKYGGNWIGGLTNATPANAPSYSNIISRSSANYIVYTPTQLTSALSSATTGQIIYIGSDINMGGTSITIPAGVTLASNRGSGGSYGAHLDGTASVFIKSATGGNVRITGLRIEGPSSSTTASSGSAIILQGPGNEVENCEIYNWPARGVEVSENSEGHVHHNYIHHNRSSSGGYGVSVLNGNALIEANYFDFNRHSIMGQRGNPDGTLSSYSPFSRYTSNFEARYNIVGPNQAEGLFDCHGGNDTAYGGMGPYPIGEPNCFAGGTITIHHNTFNGAGTYRAVGIRGYPQNSVKVYNNLTAWNYSTTLIYCQYINNIINKTNTQETTTSTYYKMSVSNNSYNGSVK